MLLTTRFNQAFGISIFASGRGLILICAWDDMGSITKEETFQEKNWLLIL